MEDVAGREAFFSSSSDDDVRAHVSGKHVHDKEEDRLRGERVRGVPARAGRPLRGIKANFGRKFKPLSRSDVPSYRERASDPLSSAGLLSLRVVLGAAGAHQSPGRRATL